MAARLPAAALLAVTLGAAVPTPESHFGFKMGDDRKLVPWSKVVSYFETLQKSSDRILVRNLGPTTEKRPFLAAWIARPDVLKDLERYRQIQKKLADPRVTPETEAAKLIAQGKTVVMITCSIHSTEVASTMTAVEFAYRLLSEDRPKFRDILDNVIFILVPSLNPDGVDIVERWYTKTLGTPFEGTSPPELYQKYVGHDNNRDWYIFSQAETRLAISQLHNQWHPQIVYDVHQQGPYVSRIFIPPWLDPVEPNIDPIITQMCNMIGAGMAADLTAAGKKGVAINASYDFWTPARHYQAYHGGMRILSESASARLATPITVTADEITENALGYNPRQASWNHLEPWLGGTWRVRDIVDYQSIAWESLLWQAAVRREDLLRNFYGVGKRAVGRSAPYAFVISANQQDRGATKILLDTLAFGLIEVEKAGDSFRAAGKTYPAGSYVIRMNQPYSSWAKALLERQQYPDLRLYPGGPPKRPYDVTAHTLPLLMGVQVDTIPDTFEAKLARAASFEELASAAARRDRNSIDWYRTAPNKPRLGLYRSHIPVMDEGWTRWLLERFNWKYANVLNADILSGNLNQRYDVILFPDQGPSSIHNGYRAGSMPPEYAGGLGDKGAQNLIEFTRNGGTLVFLNSSTDYAIGHLGVPVKSTIRGVPSRDFYSPGSLLNVNLDASHPVAAGLPATLAIWSEGSAAWEFTDPSIRSIARYPDSGVLASGWLLGEKYLAGKSALIEATTGKGKMILFGMRPQYRAQSYQSLKLLFNAMLR
jgi:hypothetical protein